MVSPPTCQRGSQVVRALPADIFVSASRPHPRIKRVTQAVTQETDAQNRCDDGHGRNYDQPPRIPDVAPRVAEIATPTGHRWRNSQSKKAESCLCDDGRREANSDLDNDDPNHVGKDVAKDDLGITGSIAMRRHDEHFFS